ncbi:MAG: tRNA (adenosine(37)-N6)-threonylcarbamoyltransferase complex ATPase subunit type 1 TsaE [Chitinophagaceae bacterium]|jgi:tRNA threonylcarbamoyladenosine biosynthesis protein TsaE|nr:tRNA (adenosine(37)-N6)-threonylcarbamoyltransferase complex ATPase subunit type 1 TsaE [Chitinophagaceae bacterium]
MEFSIENIADAAAMCRKYLSQKKVWAFHAPMGAGKTTFIHTFCQNILGIKETVSSPTFSIVNEYQSPTEGIVYHIDLYRLKDEEEILQTGIEDCILSGNLCLIEWAEKAKNLLPDNALHIYLEIIDEGKRRLKIENC